MELYGYQFQLFEGIHTLYISFLIRMMAIKSDLFIRTKDANHHHQFSSTQKREFQCHYTAVIQVRP